MFKKIVGSFAIWVIAFGVLLTILLLPTETIFETGQGGSFQGVTYEYSLQGHIHNFQKLWNHLEENKGLGVDKYDKPISENLVELFGRSMKIVLPAILLGFFLGIAKGVIDFWLKGTKGKVLGHSSTLGLLSIPDFSMIVVIQIGLLTLMSKGWLFHIDLYGYEKLENVIMNILFLTIYPTIYISNVTFQALSSEEGADYIRTARSKGIGKLVILYKHILKNSIPRILSHFNTMILYILSNLFLIEVFTQYKGAAYYMYETLGSSTSFFVGAVFSAEIVSLIGFVFLFTIIMLIANIITGTSKAFLVTKKGEAFE